MMDQVVGKSTVGVAFSELASSEAFIMRHVGPSSEEQHALLEVLGYTSLDTFIDDVVPAAIRSPMELIDSMTEADALAALRTYADKNQVFKNFIGMGYYGTYTPTVILRNILENPAWYTAYTPYQPEISQGRLEALINFQTMVSDLTGLDIANASLLDEATAAAEAMALALRTKANSTPARFFAAKDCHPQTLEVLKTRASGLGVVLVIDEPQKSLEHEVFGALLQYPATDGSLRNERTLILDLKLKKVTVILAADLLALTLITPHNVLACRWDSGGLMQGI
jgi:glycine dehydrogenase